MKKSFALFFLLALSVHSFSLEAYVFNGGGRSRAEKLAALTIAGIVNRETPRLYLQDVFETWNYSLTDDRWKLIFIQKEGVSFTEILSVKELIETFKNELNGAILYSDQETYSNFSGQSFLWQGEFAAMLCGLSNAVPIPVGKEVEWNYFAEDNIILKSFDGNNSLEIKANLTDISWSWNTTANDKYLNALNWAYENILPLCNPQSFFIREITDWAVSKKMFHLNIAGNEPNSLNFYSLSEEKALLIENLLKHFRAKNPTSLFNIYGWMEPEPLVQWLSAYGATFHEAMQANLSWFHSYPLPEAIPDRVSLVDENNLTLQKKYYIIFIGSEGDAGNWNVGFQGGAWNSNKRGKVPVAWGINLHFWEQFPYLAYYYNKTATANDGFVSVITPLGYTYSDVLPEETREWAIQESKALVEKFKMPVAYAYKHYNGQGVSTFRGIDISNYYDTIQMNNFYSGSGIETTFLFEPKLWTQTAYENRSILFNHLNDNTFYGNISNLNAKKAEIIDRLKRKEAPYFYLAGYQRFVGETTTLNESADITITRLNELKLLLESDPEIGHLIEFVTPEKFNLLLQAKLGRNNIPYDDSEISPNGINDNNLKDIQLIWNSHEKQLRISKPENVQELMVRITDMQGKTQIISSSNLEFDLSYLKSSLYIISVQTENEIINKKIVVN